jgi:hypothetical protein
MPMGAPPPDGTPGCSSRDERWITDVNDHGSKREKARAAGVACLGRHACVAARHSNGPRGQGMGIGHAARSRAWSAAHLAHCASRSHVSWSLPPDRSGWLHLRVGYRDEW